MAEITVQMRADVGQYLTAMRKAEQQTREVADTFGITERDAKQALGAIERESKKATTATDRLSFAAKGLGGRFGEMSERLANLGRAGAILGVGGALTVGLGVAANAGARLASAMIDVARNGAKAADEMERMGFVTSATADAAKQTGAAFASIESTGTRLSTLFAATLGPALDGVAEYLADITTHTTRQIEAYPLLGQAVASFTLGPLYSLGLAYKALKGDVVDATAALEGQQRTLQAIREAQDMASGGYDSVPRRIEGGLTRAAGRGSRAAAATGGRDLSKFVGGTAGGEMGIVDLPDTDGYQRWMEAYGKWQEEIQAKNAETAEAIQGAWSTSLDNVAGAFSSLTDAFGEQAPALYTVQKLLTIAQIGASTAAAVMGALAQTATIGPIASGILAGSYIALGVANAAAVAASSIGSPPRATGPGRGGSDGAGGYRGGPSRFRPADGSQGSAPGSGWSHVRLQVDDRSYGAIVEQGTEQQRLYGSGYSFTRLEPAGRRGR